MQMDEFAQQDLQALATALRVPMAIKRESLTPAEDKAIAPAILEWRARNNAAFDAFQAARADSDVTLRAAIAAAGADRLRDGWTFSTNGEWVKMTAVVDVASVLDG